MTDNYTLVFTDDSNPNTIEIEPYSIDFSTSLTFYGKNALNYWYDLNNNLLLLLANFGGASPPPKPIIGQIWYDSKVKKLKFFDKTWQLIEQPRPDLSMYVHNSNDTITGNLVISQFNSNAKSVTTRGYVDSRLANCTYGDKDGVCWVRHTDNNYVVISTSATKSKQTVTLPFEMVDTNYAVTATCNETSSYKYDGMHWTVYNKTTTSFQISFANSVATLAIIITGFAK